MTIRCLLSNVTRAFMLLVTVTLFLIAQTAAAQTNPQPSAQKQELKISGTVRNSLNNAMEGATVEDLVTGTTAVTNAKGAYVHASLQTCQ